MTTSADDPTGRGATEAVGGPGGRSVEGQGAALADDDDAPPLVCPTCGTANPQRRPRCVGCGRVFGEVNRCPHCHAIAGVFLDRKGGATCAACGRPRPRLPGTVVLGGPGAEGVGGAASDPDARGAGPSSAAPATLTAPAGPGVLLGRALGVLSLAGGVLGAALVAVALPGAGGLLAALFVAAGGVGLGAWSLRGASRSAAARRARAEELALLELARDEGGRLTATGVARRFRWTTAEAEAALSRLVDETRVGLEVEADGRLTYVFREVEAELARTEPAGPRVRVAGHPVPAPSERQGGPGQAEDAGDDVEVPAGEPRRRGDQAR